MNLFTSKGTRRNLELNMVTDFFVVGRPLAYKYFFFCSDHQKIGNPKRIFNIFINSALLKSSQPDQLLFLDFLFFYLSLFYLCYMGNDFLYKAMHFFCYY